MPRGFSLRPDHPTVPSLVRLHAELHGQLQANKAEAERIADQMRAVETVIRLFDGSYDVRRIAAKRKNMANPFFKKGEAFRVALGVLRTADKPLTAREVVLKMLEGRGVVDASAVAVRKLVGGLHRSLVNHEGRIVTRVGEGMPARWQIA